MKQFDKNTIFNLRHCAILFFALFFLLFTSCSNDSSQDFLEKQSLFTLEYGNFENQIKLFDVEKSENIFTQIIMRDGFFYLTNGESDKLMKFTSYGDLIGLIYDETQNPTPSFIQSMGDSVSSALDSQSGDATKIAVSYPFNKLGPCTVDSNKNIYVADYLPISRYEEDTDSSIILRQIILCFAPDGSFINFLTQDGLEGKPFPYIKSLHTTANNELVVICIENKSFVVYFFSPEGKLVHELLIDNSLLPQEELNFAEESYVSLENIFPDFYNQVLYLKADYYGVKIDKSTKVSSGIEFEKSIVFPLDLRTNDYLQPIPIPPFEKTMTQAYVSEMYLHPYSFLGVDENGALFFVITDDTGLSILITHTGTKKIIKHKIEFDTVESVYQHFSLSKTGIISALIANEENAEVAWWRTDLLVDSIIE